MKRFRLQSWNLNTLVSDFPLVLFLVLIVVPDRSKGSAVTGLPSSVPLGSVFTLAHALWLQSPNKQFQLDLRSWPDAGIVQCMSGVRYTFLSPNALIWTFSVDPEPWQGNNCTLELQTDGVLSFSVNLNGSSSASVVWKTPTAGMGVQNLSLLDDGNLVLVDSLGKVVWQSFGSFRTLSIIPSGMRFSQNMTLVQRVSVYSDFSVPGCYGARLSQQSLSLLLFTRANQYVYANLDLNVSTDHPAQYMVIHQDMQFYDNQSVLIGTVPHNVLTSDPFPNGTDLVGYAVLDDDANLVIRRPNPENPVLSFTYYNSSIRGFCSHPLACGEYGLCNEETSTCSCPQGFTMATEKPSCDSQDEAARKCSCPEQFQMQKFGSTCIASDASYSLQPIEVLFPRQPSAIPIVSQEECRSLCAQNSSCNAALYDSSSSSCALFPILYTIATPSKGKSTGQILFTKISSIKKASNTATHVIVSSIVASAIIIVLLGVLVCCWWRIQKSTRKSQGHFLQEVPRLPHRFSFASLQAATRNFSKVIATGAHGSVFEGELSTPSGVVKVAVKKLHEVGNTMDDQFKAEVATIGSVSHVNLVSLKGFCMKKNSRLLVFEFMSNGSLEKWLYATETHRSMDMSIDGSRDILSETQQLGSSLPSSSPLRTVLDWNKRCRIALDTARGLEYLHHKSGTRIIHCDVKPANILLDKDFHAKVGDFGLAKLVCSDSRSFAMTKIQGTRGYLAPEWLQEASITTKSDVFSYGVVLIELLTGRQCIDAERGFMPTWVMKTVAAIGAPGYCTPQWVGMDDPISMISPSDAEALRSTIIDERLSADEVPTNTFLRTLLLALACVQTDPGDRPSMDSVVQILEDLTEAPSSLPDIKLSHLTCNPYCLLDKSTSSSRTDFPSGGFMSTYSQVEAR